MVNFCTIFATNITVTTNSVPPFHHTVSSLPPLSLSLPLPSPSLSRIGPTALPGTTRKRPNICPPPYQFSNFLAAPPSPLHSLSLSPLNGVRSEKEEGRVGGELMVGREVRRDTNHFTVPPPLPSPTTHQPPTRNEGGREGWL